MNILVFSEAAWNNENSFGNTVSNFFIGDAWKSDSFSNFYARRTLPSKEMDIDFYNLSSFDIAKGFFKGKIKGRHFYKYPEGSDLVYYKNAELKERQMIDKLHHSKKQEFLMFMNRALWKSGIWISKDFKTFIKKNKPDIFFAFLNSTFISLPLIKYLKKANNCKIVFFAADELYYDYGKHSMPYRFFLRRDFQQALNLSDKLYAITDELAELYHKAFNKHFSILRKSCEDVDNNRITKIASYPLKIVYAGNLLYGRDETLAKLAEVIDEINEHEHRAFLEIYSGTIVNEKINEKLNIRNTSEMMGIRSNKEIIEILQNADIVLHVETFDNKYINEVKYSFSTKITDCLQAGSVIMAIGDKSISSIQYVKKIKGTIVVESLDQIKESLEAVINDISSFSQRIEEARKFALQNHDIKKLQKNLRNDFQHLIESNK